MAATLLQAVLFAASISTICAQDQHSPIIAVYPGVIFYSWERGYFTLEAQTTGNVTFRTSANHSIYYKDIDLLGIIKLVDATPPTWDEYGTYGYLGVFRGLQKISVFIHAKDKEDRPLQYRLVAGDLPVGISLNPLTGELKGVAPDIDATYILTVRATNSLGAFADAIFKLVIKNSHVCLQNPCQNEGTCHESQGTFQCNCIHPFGGKLCELNCTNNPLGVSSGTIHDGQMSGYGTSGTYFGYNARFGRSGWLGRDEHSWLQIDLGKPTDLHGVQMQGMDGRYYTSQYYLQYSLNGRNFENYTSPFTGQTQILQGRASTSVITSHLTSNLRTRFVRLVPVTWNRSYGAFMRVELLGCYMDE